MKPPKHAVISGFLSRTKDRFFEYNEEKTLEERYRLAATIPGVTGVESVFPYEINEVELTRQLLKKYDLQIAAVNVNVKAEAEFRNGGLTSTEKAVREKALQFIKDAKIFAQSVGANKVTCCPLGDGYEFNFECDYAQSWKYLVETLGESAAFLPEIPLFIEYKPSETRGKCFVDTAAKTLCLLNDIGIKQMGITLDFGHSLYGNENPAEVVALLAESQYPFYVHINDNDGKWDWDYMVGTKHLLDYIEFLFYLRKYEYNDFLTSDTSPTRWDIKGTFEVNTRLTTKIWQRLDQLNLSELQKLIFNRNFLKTWEYIEQNIIGMK
jgi:xylose isomerase